ncbi:MAG: hypothetical protein K0S06_2954 [Microvirga sp.]|jgi:serralysin|nr:hypothetical protein [Microvirga sp.]
MRKQLQAKAAQLAATSATPVASLENDYLQSLLWLTPSNPFGTAESTTISFAFGGARSYTIDDPESTVDRLRATGWNTGSIASADTFLPNGDRVAVAGLPIEQAAVLVALAAWIAPTNLTLAPAADFETATFKFLVTNEAGMREFWSGERGVLGFSELPNDYGPNYGYYGEEEQPYSPGYAVFNQEGYGWTSGGLTPGGYGYVTVLHEIGHLFGLDHPWDEGGVYWENGTQHAEPGFPGATASKTGVNGLNQGVFTTMTYNDGWSGQPSKSANWGYQIGPGAFDIAAMQKLYGTDASHHAGDDSYTLPEANAAGTGWFCLWDAGGMDTIKAPLNAGAATIDLRAATLIEGDAGAGGYVSWVKGIAGGFTIAKGAVIENAEGGNGADTLIGNQSGNVLKGHGGADRLQGGSGADMLWGGAGNDVFAFKTLADFRSGADLSAACIDTVSDFVRGQDKLEFRGFDADPVADGVQAVSFRFVGTDKSFVANDRSVAELRFDSRTHTLHGDCNNDGALDFQIMMLGVSSLSATDFLL